MCGGISVRSHVASAQHQLSSSAASSEGHAESGTTRHVSHLQELIVCVTRQGLDIQPHIQQVLLKPERSVILCYGDAPAMQMLHVQHAAVAAVSLLAHEERTLSKLPCLSHWIHWSVAVGSVATGTGASSSAAGAGASSSSAGCGSRSSYVKEIGGE